MSKTTIIMPCYERDELLDYGLGSLVSQDLGDVQILVMNDGRWGKTKEVCDKHGVHSMFTGDRNEGQANWDYLKYWRCPGFCINQGVRATDSEILVLCCPEMYHLNDTIAQLIAPLADNPKAMCIPQGRDDPGCLLATLRTGTQDPVEIERAWVQCHGLRIELPFLLAVRRDHFVAIGGYDEDFTGIAYDDTDIVERLEAYGLQYVHTKAKTVHLQHRRDHDQSRVPYNQRLYEARWGTVVRNVGREWGRGSPGELAR